MIKTIGSINWRYATKSFNTNKKVSEKEINKYFNRSF